MSEAYTYPSHVHALSFVSIKLSGNTNYREWQEQMMCLVDSHDMIGFIDGTLKESQEITNDSEKKGKYRQWKRSDTLVKGWIFGSLSEHVMVNVVGLDTSNEVWDNLKAAYGTPRNIEMQEECPYPSNVNVANFVSILLEGETNYREWEAQMICLLESSDMLSFIDDTLEGGKYRDQKRSDTLVKGWIFGSLSEDVMATVVDLDTTNEVWSNLKATYGTPHNKEMKEEYPYPSNVNVANFVSIVLEGETNYWEWKEQMICLLESYDMLDFINGTLEKDKYIEWKRSDTLVKGWIFGSLSIGVIHTVWGDLDTAFEVWNKLTTSYNGVGSLGSPKIENTSRYLPLYKTILRGDWEAAREILNGDEDALTIKLNPEGYTALHIAMDEYADIQFVDRLLKEITPESLPTMLTNSKYNALHCAAMIGNIEAAKMLVEKNPNLLFIADMYHCLPVGRALVNSHITTFQYLLDSCIQHIGISKQDGYNSPFEGNTGAAFLGEVINAGLMDVACELINKYPNMARKHYDIPLRYIAKKGDLYYSGTQYNFYQTFVYTHVPIEINNFDYTNNLQDIENQDTCNRKSVSSNARRSCFYYVIQKIYAKFWNVVLLHVAHVKHLREEKVKHNKALILLKRICEEAGKTDEGSDISQHCGEAFKSAVQNDISEAVEEIMRYFPQAIWTKDNDYYYPTQIAIRDRCLKAHNVMLRHLGRDKYLLHACYDIDSNNYLHLAGRLAPISKLNLVSGAALQMQREVQWFKGVESFERPQFKEAPNGKGETPIMVFRREHKELRKDGESWMKKTADSYTITAALIITIVFAAAITVPGGNDNSGKANYATKTSFFIFIISDAISLFTSTTSLLLFLSILTARYLEEDFLYRLPLRLILGLGMLFVSVTSMMVAFSATLYLTFGHGRAWIMYPVAVLACLPIASFVTLQLPLLFELINSTYYNRVFSKHRFPKIK